MDPLALEADPGWFEWALMTMEEELAAQHDPSVIQRRQREAEQQRKRQEREQKRATWRDRHLGLSDHA